MSLRMVLFDLDGTLADTAEDIALATNLALAEDGRPPLTVAQVRALVSSGARKLLASSFDGDASEADINRLTARLFAHYGERPAVHTRVFGGLDMLIGEFAGYDLSWGIVSNKPVALVRPIVNALKLTPSPVCVLGGDSVAAKKPDPLPLLHACETAGIPPGETLYVGDAEIDVRAAQAASMPVAIVGFGYAPNEATVRTWQPDCYADTVAELRTFVLSLQAKAATA
ncbi:MAG: HAD-IA family hydrolase [Gammaproteobacteria bacterium]